MHAAAPRHPEESLALLRHLSPRVSPNLLAFPFLPTSRYLRPPALPYPSSFSRSRGARASTRASGVSACTYIRYLSAYIWVPIYRYQMVNERVDARSGRPQLAATQSFVYRGAVCATARTGWPRNVVFFSARRRQREIPRGSQREKGNRVVRAGEWLQQGRNALRT